jgi:hypothetical protein
MHFAGRRWVVAATVCAVAVGFGRPLEGQASSHSAVSGSSLIGNPWWSKSLTYTDYFLVALRDGLTELGGLFASDVLQDGFTIGHTGRTGCPCP